MQKIAILGGTFDPVHQGHLQIAQTALAQLQLQRVVWLPIRQPFHKRHASVSFEQRLEMVQLAVAGQAGFEYLSDQASAASYAIDMLRRLQALYPQSQWYWLIGQDALQTLPRWKGRQALAKTCCWLVAPRSNQMSQAAAAAAAEATCQQVAEIMLKQLMPIRWQLLQMPPLSLSSSLIRQRRQQGRSIQGMVPELVEQYILAHRLYQSG